MLMYHLSLVEKSQFVKDKHSTPKFIAFNTDLNFQYKMECEDATFFDFEGVIDQYLTVLDKMGIEPEGRQLTFAVSIPTKSIRDIYRVGVSIFKITIHEDSFTVEYDATDYDSFLLSWLDNNNTQVESTVLNSKDEVDVFSLDEYINTLITS